MTSFKFSALRSLGIISGLCLAMLTPSIASALIIDSFQNANAISRVNPLTNGTSAAALEPGLSGVINTGDRQISASKLAGSVANAGRGARLTIGSGDLALSNDTGIFGSFDLNYTNIGTVDASAAYTVVKFIVNDNDASGGTFTLTLGSDGPVTNSKDFTLPGNTLGVISFLTNAANFPTVNLAAITSISLSYVATGQSGDLGIEGGLMLATVPEPSSLAIALTGLGLAGVYFRRRRNQLSA